MLLPPDTLGVSLWWAFLAAWAVALVLGALILHFPPLKRLILRREEGRTHTLPRFFRLGSILLVGGFLGALLLDTRLVWDRTLLTFVTGGLLAFTLGLMDDMRPLAWRWQLMGQLGLGGLLLSAGMAIEYIHLGGGVVLDLAALPLFPVLATLLWVVLVMNAVNWVDGADGLMAGVVGATLVTLAILSLRPEVNQPTLALLGFMLLGAVSGFLCFNWYPAKLVAGTGGAAFLGFMLAALSVYAGTKVATALLVLAIPILDAFSVILTRLRRGRSPFLPDRSHFHHALLSLGWSQRRIALVYAMMTGFMGVLALSTRYLEKFWVLCGVGCSFFVVLGWMQWTLTRRDSQQL